MRTAAQTSAAKLRGGFYTPDALVDLCLRRAAELVPRGSLRVLEPSAGDGAFVRGIARSAGLRTRIEHLQAIEPLEIEAEKARQAVRGAGLAGAVSSQSAIAWAAATAETYDVAVGNPPFVRYQFASPADRIAATDLGERMGLRLAAVGNLWIGVLLGALSRLRAGGAFAFVVPSECLTGVSASVVRDWLVRECETVRLDLFAPCSFPGVLQEVLVLSGRRGAKAAGSLRLRLVEAPAGGARIDREHRAAGGETWTRYLLSPRQVAALEAAADARVARVGELVAFEVSIVTGANAFFTLTREDVERHRMLGWARPLLPRIRHAAGLRYSAADHRETEARGARVWLLDFSAQRPDPTAEPGPAAYLQGGERDELDARYKCRTREPWYRVPGITRGALLLSKRSHHHPRVVVNEAGVFTTDTIYRGRMLTPAITAAGVAANFHNSLTLLSAELEGRSFGGGVLELVPSEIGRLLTHADDPPPALLDELDAIARRSKDGAGLIAATDASLVRRGLVDEDVLAELAAARALLVARRLQRNRRAPATPVRDEPEDLAAAG